MQNKYINYERTNYQELKNSYLAGAFSACRAKFHNGIVKKWGTNETEWGYASYDFDDSFSLPIEQLMIKVIETITYSGRFIQAHQLFLDEIHNILSKYTKEELFADLDDEEKEDCLYDLKSILDNQLLEI